jgi:glutamine amidotransferase
MCRIAAYFGRPVQLSRLLDVCPHGLREQSLHARQMMKTHVAGDGWGVGWFLPEADPTPGLLKSEMPLWSCQNAKTAPRAILSGSMVGHVRLASGSIETCYLNTPLYVMDDHLWTLNGELTPWPGPLSMALRRRLDPDHEADLRGATDAEMLGALWRTHFRRTGGEDAAAALRSMLREARDLVRAHDGTLRTNIILASAEEVLAVRFTEGMEPNTLYTHAHAEHWRGGALVASEPLDDSPGWREVKTDALVRLDGRGVHLEPLALEDAPEREPQQQSA